MPDSKPYLYLCARGWEHAGWTGDPYPEDLPADWRLTYYANEFRCVLVPADSWEAADDARVAAWREDVAAGFSFFVERPPAGPSPGDRSKAGNLAERFGGWLLPLPETVTGAPTLRCCRLLDAPIDTAAFLLESPVPSQDLMAQRRLLEALAAGAGDARKLLLCVSGSPPPVELLRNLQQLSQLLGLA